MPDARPGTTPPSREMYLPLAEGVSVSIDRDEAWRMSEKDFAEFYRRHVYGAKRREAKLWAKAQVELRDAILVAQRG